MRGNKMKNAEKPKNFKASIKRSITFNKKLIPLAVVALVLSSLASILSIIGPDKLKEITNVITAGFMTSIDTDKVKSIALVLVAFYTLSFIFNYLQGFIMAIITNKYARSMREEIAKKINILPLSYYDKNTVGDILSRIINDVDTVSSNLNNSLSTLVSAVTLLIGAIIMMFYTNWILAIVAIFSSLFGFVFIAIIMSKSQKYFFAVQDELGDINGHIEETFTGNSVVRIYNASEEMNEKFDTVNEKLFRDGLKSQFYSSLMHPLMGFIGNFGYVAVCVIGAILTMNGTITFGVIVAFMIYVRLFTQPLMSFAQGMSGLQSASAGAERVFEFLDEAEMTKEEDCTYLERNKVKGDIEFKNVKFGYNPDKLIIKDFSANIKAGQKIAIVGPTGAGKTTMVNLLMKFYDINSGDILIDGVSIKKLKRENIHELFTMVLQDTWLFNGTIKDNIVYNKKNVSDDEVKSACKSVGLDHFIKTLPEGYNTILDDSTSISQGQKQLLTIARSMIENTPFLILDEATSSVDTRTEKLVQAAMDNIAKDKTSFIIAHRLSTIKNADLILVMNEGNIVEVGTHDELLNKNGFYADLYNSQFQTT